MQEKRRAGIVLNSGERSVLPIQNFPGLKGSCFPNSKNVLSLFRLGTR